MLENASEWRSIRPVGRHSRPGPVPWSESSLPFSPPTWSATAASWSRMRREHSSGCAPTARTSSNRNGKASWAHLQAHGRRSAWPSSHSVVDAVECAVVLQRGMAERNARPRPANASMCASESTWATSSLMARIDKAMASISPTRLQGLADPGGILISGTAYDQVKTKTAVGYALSRRAGGEEHRRTGAGLPRLDGPGGRPVGQLMRRRRRDHRGARRSLPA